MSYWQIRNVDPKTRNSVKVYAAQKNLTLAKALAQIVQKALNK